jgi:hypothetical protein
VGAGLDALPLVTAGVGFKDAEGLSGLEGKALQAARIGTSHTASMALGAMTLAPATIGNAVDSVDADNCLP